MVMTTPDGQQRETLYEFQAEGGKLTGKVYMLFGAQQIVDGKIEGETFTFATVMRMGEQERRLVTEGRIAGEELKLKRVMPAGFGPPPGAESPGLVGARRQGSAEGELAEMVEGHGVVMLRLSR